ncbi:leptin receptor gene-related protein [Anopheles ziemanni]|uniref:AGAP008693-PA-like protein n=1 Tax=Anopheles sinensis TaxID=74873 RepID=A0A084VCP8_ANOSI|nr:leptin receptor gene-related protein [Anopheles coustani]XP_058126613.1 leptin receptor gene-related protein [Anopheles coustani]XP_058126614.1 leptin receptor gene-related protein [Anopheles coustani]XP_058166302.1 leptin receptor gene-related protein [Anopheles ziemanni]KFB35742.1 AGAP008693-PA-like protein [Anopheles sinensis]
MLAMLGSIGMTMIILACALPTYNLWWPIFVVLFYILCPIPTMIAKRSQNADDGVRAPNAMFATIGIVLSSFALPIVLARASVIQWGACLLTLAGNAVAYTSFLAYYFGFESGDSSMW